MADHIKRIARKIRGHDQRIQTLEEERQGDVQPVKVRQFAETAVTTENVTVRVTEDPVAIFDETDFNRSEFSETSDANSNTVVSEETVSNTTCVELDEYRALDTAQSEDVEDDADRFGVGSDATTPAYSNRTLNAPSLDEEGEPVTFQIDEYEVDGTEVTMNGFLGTQQANGETITEAAIISIEGRQYNHAVHNSFEKSNTESVTYEAVFTYNTG